jgi:hypothetical protein
VQGSLYNRNVTFQSITSCVMMTHREGNALKKEMIGIIVEECNDDEEGRPWQ